MTRFDPRDPRFNPYNDDRRCVLCGGRGTVSIPFVRWEAPSLSAPNHFEPPQRAYKDYPCPECTTAVVGPGAKRVDVHQKFEVPPELHRDEYADYLRHVRSGLLHALMEQLERLGLIGFKEREHDKAEYSYRPTMIGSAFVHVAPPEKRSWAEHFEAQEPALAKMAAEAAQRAIERHALTGDHIPKTVAVTLIAEAVRDALNLRDETKETTR